MLIIPAIDIKEGRCVRLEQGDFERETVYSSDPVKQAVEWESAGAGMIHIVDLDGAAGGRPKNKKLIEEICRTVKCPVQLGGGIRDLETATGYFEIGLTHIVLGTLLIKDRDLALRIVESFPQKVLAGIDVKDGKASGDGWMTPSEITAGDLAAELENWPLAGIVFTDISRDGMMQGPNIGSIRKMGKATGLPLIASGGVSSLKDLKELAEIPEVKGAITGKALYSGAIDLAEAIKKIQT